MYGKCTPLFYLVIMSTSRLLNLIIEVKRFQEIRPTVVILCLRAFSSFRRTMTEIHSRITAKIMAHVTTRSANAAKRCQEWSFLINTVYACGLADNKLICYIMFHTSMMGTNKIAPALFQLEGSQVKQANAEARLTFPCCCQTFS